MPCQLLPPYNIIPGMRLYKQRDIYYVEFPGGKRRSLKTKDGRKAKGLFREIQRETLLENLKEFDRPTGTSLSQFTKLYLLDPERQELSDKTLKADDLALRKLIGVIGDIQLANIKKGHIASFKASCKAQGNKPVSINTYLRHIRAALHYAANNDYIEAVPLIKIIKTGKPLPRVISQEDVDKILAEAEKTKPELYRIIQFALFTGARREEIIKMKYEHISAGSIKIFGKGNKERLTPLVKPAKEVLENQHFGKIFSYQHVSTISNYYRETTRAAGVVSRFHDLRHTAATNMLNKGIPFEVVQSILGHADLRTTQLYAKVMQETVRKEMKKME
ncbi:MAG: tyrosine-type recombinase/integrase [Desulfobacterales bacterium]|nr:tyrosine-type recombinase/integrase [Desulfobacterales bacterium]